MKGADKHTSQPAAISGADWNRRYCNVLGNVLTCNVVYQRIAAQFHGVSNGGIVNCRHQRGTGSDPSAWSVHSCGGAVDVWPGPNSAAGIVAFAKAQPEVWDAWLDASPGDVHVQIVPNPPDGWVPPCAGGAGTPTGGGTQTWPKVLNAKQIAQLAFNAMGANTPTKDVAIATAIALCESGGQTCPANTHGDTLHGLWQSDGCGGSSSGADLCNPFTAASSMAGAYHAHGWDCWGCGPSHKGGYLIHMGTAQKAAQGLKFGDPVPGIGSPGGQGPCDPRCLQGSGKFFTDHPDLCGGCLPSSAGRESLLSGGCANCQTLCPGAGPLHFCLDKVFASGGILLATVALIFGAYLLVRSAGGRSVGQTVVQPIGNLFRGIGRVTGGRSAPAAPAAPPQAAARKPTSGDALRARIRARDALGGDNLRRQIAEREE